MCTWKNKNIFKNVSSWPSYRWVFGTDAEGQKLFLNCKTTTMDLLGPIKDPSSSLSGHLKKNRVSMYRHFSRSFLQACRLCSSRTFPARGNVLILNSPWGIFLLWITLIKETVQQFQQLLWPLLTTCVKKHLLLFVLNSLSANILWCPLVFTMNRRVFYSLFLITHYFISLLHNLFSNLFSRLNSLTHLALMKKLFCNFSQMSPFLLNSTFFSFYYVFFREGGEREPVLNTISTTCGNHSVSEGLVRPGVLLLDKIWTGPPQPLHCNCAPRTSTVNGS